MWPTCEFLVAGNANTLIWDHGDHGQRPKGDSYGSNNQPGQGKQPRPPSSQLVIGEKRVDNDAC